MPIEIPENKNASVSRPPKIYTCQRICGQDDDRGAFNVCVNVHRTNSPEHHGQGIVPHIVPRDGLYCEGSWSEWQDLNLRPPRPERVSPRENSMFPGKSDDVQSAPFTFG